MQLSVECTCCGDVTKIELTSIVKALTDSIENNAIFAGFYCPYCYYELEADEED